jgi:glycosyltransferase involved in cell wall biosynthesis
MKTVSCIIPVFNNAPTLAALAEQLVAVSHHLNYRAELIFVNDCSTDDSREVLLALKKKYSDIKIFQLAKNCGQSAALIVGLANATSEICVCMDADLQDPPQAISQLILEISEANVHVVFAGRTGKYESGSRHLSAHLFKKLFSMLTNGAIPANAGLFFAIKTKAASNFVDYAGSKPYMLALIFKMRLSCSVIAVQRQHRAGGGSGYTAWKRWKTGIKGLLSLMPIRKKKLPAHFIKTL